jgi:hypothetical protein
LGTNFPSIYRLSLSFHALDFLHAKWKFMAWKKRWKNYSTLNHISCEIRSLSSHEMHVFLAILPISESQNGISYSDGKVKLDLCLIKWILTRFMLTLTFWYRSFTFNSINHQPDATVFQFIIPTFVYISTCFGRFPAHHQEPSDCSGSRWFYLRIVVTAVRHSWSGRPAGPTTNTARLSPRHEGKTRGCHCSHWAPDDGRENARNMLSFKQTSG